jgi:predicted transcriptional regulator
MPNRLHLHLSRRESQIMDIIYRLGEASVGEVAKRMPDRPAYNAVRNTMMILERKGYLEHRQDGTRYVFSPSQPVEEVKQSAVTHLLNTFFKGSPSEAVLALLGTPEVRVTERDLDEIAKHIEKARERLK